MFSFQFHFYIMDIDQIECLKVFPENYKYYFCSPKSKRAMPLDKLEKYAKKLKIDYKSFESTCSAYQKALKDRCYVLK